MQREAYVFQIKGVFAPELREQAARLAAAVPEAFSRKDCPKLWAATDRIRARPKADQKTLSRRRRMRTALGVVNLLLSLFALGPAVVAPEELLAVLVIGLLCLGSGIAALWGRHRKLLSVLLILWGLFYGISGLGASEEYRPLLVLGGVLLAVAVLSLIPWGRRKKARFQREGNQLFDARGGLPADSCLELRFTQQGLELPTGGEEPDLVPYGDFLGILETEDLLLVGIEQRGFLLAKSELVQGDFPQFKAELAQCVTWIKAQDIG